MYFKLILTQSQRLDRIQMMTNECRANMRREAVLKNCFPSEVTYKNGVIDGVVDQGPDAFQFRQFYLLQKIDLMSDSVQSENLDVIVMRN